MASPIATLGTATGLMGALICLVAGLARVSGTYYLYTFQTTTLFNAGVGIMVFACVLQLHALLKARDA